MEEDKIIYLEIFSGDGTKRSISLDLEDDDVFQFVFNKKGDAPLETSYTKSIGFKELFKIFKGLK